MTVMYLPGRGLLVTLQGPHGGVTFMLHESMSIAALQNYLREMIAFYC